MTGFPRASVYHAEKMADQALSLVADNRTLQTGITRRLLDVYLARPTRRSVRKAARLSDELSGAIIPETGMSLA